MRSVTQIATLLILVEHMGRSPLCQAFESISEATRNDSETGIYSESVIKAAYMRFVAEFGKSYGTMADMESKYDAFRTNYERVHQHNSSVDEEGKSPPFTMAINRFSDMTEEEFFAERLSKDLSQYIKSKSNQDGKKRLQQSKVIPTY